MTFRYNQTGIEDDMVFNYRPSSTVSNMHNIWRFGNIDQVSRLASRDKGDRDEYMNGVFGLSIVLMIFFFSWIVFLIVQRFRGSAKAGFLSGRLTYSSNDDNETTNRALSRQSKIQGTFFFLGFIIFAMCGVLLLAATPKLSKGAKEIGELNRNVRAAIDEALEIATHSHEIEKRFKYNNTFEEMLDTQDVCPNARNDPILKDLGINATLNSIMYSIYVVRGFSAQHELSRVIEHLNDMRQISKKVGEDVRQYDSNDYLAKSFSLFTIISTLFLMATCLITYSHITHEPLGIMTNFLIMPMFICCTLFAIVMTVGTLVGSMMNSDFCAGGNAPGSPQGTVANAMLERGIQTQDLTYKSLLYYESKCSIKNPWEYVTEYGMEIQKGNELTLSLSRFFEENGVANMTDICGNDLRPVLDTLRDTQDDLRSLSDSLQKAIELARCGRVRPLYLKVFYGTTCSESVDGLTNAFVAFLLISLCGMSMISLRAALYDVILIDDRTFEDEYNEYLANTRSDSVNLKKGTFETASVESAFSSEMVSTGSGMVSTSSGMVSTRSGMVSTSSEMENRSIHNDDDEDVEEPEFRHDEYHADTRSDSDNYNKQTSETESVESTFSSEMISTGSQMENHTVHDNADDFNDDVEDPDFRKI